MYRFVVVAALLPVLRAQSAKPGDWPLYNHDLAGTRYSALAQINTGNVAKLAPAWSFTTRGQAPPANAEKRKGKGAAGGIGNEVTPVVVNGVMYVPAGNLVIALDAAAGKEVWRYPLTMGAASS